MSTAADYIGRRFDLLAFRGVNPRMEVQLSQSLFDAEIGGEVCTGVQKLAQRWALEFLTIRGSMGFHLASRGSDFLLWAKQGRLRTEFDVQAFFNFAAQQVRTNLVNEDRDDAPSDERLQRADLVRLALFDGTIQLYVHIINLDGDARRVILPISVTPSNLQI
jgi:hypothetical protein